jgi:hypothetical protein
MMLTASYHVALTAQISILELDRFYRKVPSMQHLGKVVCAELVMRQSGSLLALRSHTGALVLRVFSVFLLRAEVFVIEELASIECAHGVAELTAIC